MKSLLLVDDAFRAGWSATSSPRPDYRVDRYVFGAREAEQNQCDDLARSLRSYVASIRCGHPRQSAGLWNPRKSAAANVARLFKRSAELSALLGVERIFRILFEENRTPFYMLDEMDRPVIDNSKFRFLPRCTRYFKRELPANIINAFLYTSDKTESPDSILQHESFRAWAEKLRPISLGISDEEFDRAAAVTGRKEDRSVLLRQFCIIGRSESLDATHFSSCKQMAFACTLRKNTILRTLITGTAQNRCSAGARRDLARIVTGITRSRPAARSRCADSHRSSLRAAARKRGVRLLHARNVGPLRGCAAGAKRTRTSSGRWAAGPEPRSRLPSTFPAGGIHLHRRGVAGDG